MTTLPEPDERGALDVDPAVLRKIVEYAADTAPATRHRTRTVAGLGVGEAGPRAKVTARSRAGSRSAGAAPGTDAGSAGDAPGTEVDIRLWVTLVYPGPVRAAVAQIRERVDADLRRMTGYRLRSFTVEVDALQSDRSPRPDRVS